MNWIQRYNLRQFIRNSIWLMPVIGIVVGMLSVRCLNFIEERAGWQAAFNPDATRTLFATLAGSMFTFIVFLASMLLLLLQVASAQLTPRVVGIVFQDAVTRFSLTLFTFTFTFTLSVLLRIQASVPGITPYVSAYLCLLSLGVFLFLVNHVGKSLRPSGALRTVAHLGHEVIKSVYPRHLSQQQKNSRAPLQRLREPTGTVPSPKDGVFLAFDLEGIVALAREKDCVLELVPQVGDFIAAGAPLFRIFGDKARPSASALCQTVALGVERTIEQDPTFALRIIVDIASKSLSPAINDPTTAVLAIDQLHHLLRSVGGRHLDEGVVCDQSGALRLFYRTPDWEDFVYLAVTEIRQFGGTSIQVVRRLRAMLENLVEVLPPERTPLLRSELALLQRAARRFFTEPEDRALANESDLQGVGGKHAESSAPPGGPESSTAEPKAN
jgi:uncharacterized membrane protein